MHKISNNIKSQLGEYKKNLSSGSIKIDGRLYEMQVSNKKYMVRRQMSSNNLLKLVTSVKDFFARGFSTQTRAQSYADYLNSLILKDVSEGKSNLSGENNSIKFHDARNISGSHISILPTNAGKISGTYQDDAKTGKILAENNEVTIPVPSGNAGDMAYVSPEVMATESKLTQPLMLKLYESIPPNSNLTRHLTDDGIYKDYKVTAPIYSSGSEYTLVRRDYALYVGGEEGSEIWFDYQDNGYIDTCEATLVPGELLESIKEKFGFLISHYKFNDSSTMSFVHYPEHITSANDYFVRREWHYAQMNRDKYDGYTLDFLQFNGNSAISEGFEKSMCAGQFPKQEVFLINGAEKRYRGIKGQREICITDPWKKIELSAIKIDPNNNVNVKNLADLIKFIQHNPEVKSTGTNGGKQTRRHMKLDFNFANRVAKAFGHINILPAILVHALKEGATEEIQAQAFAELEKMSPIHTV